MSKTQNKIQTQFKSATQSSYIAHNIAQNLNRGTATESKIETVLNQLRENLNLKSLKKFDNNTIQAFIFDLQNRVEQGKLSQKTTSGYISAANDIVKYVNENMNKSLESISAQSNGLSRGSVEYQNRTVSQEVHTEFKEFLSSQSDPRAQALMNSVELQREFGLRLRESLSIKQNTIKQALKTNELKLSRTDGTKNSQPRTIPIVSESQRQALRNTYDFLKSHNLKSLIPTATRAEQYHFAQNIRTEFNQSAVGKMDYHGERHFFAQEMIKTYTKKEVSEALGHHRAEILKHYIPMWFSFIFIYISFRYIF